MIGIPEKLINFRVYRNASEFLGVAQITLPQIQAMTASIKGSGISGEVDAVVTGHYQSMSMTLQFRTPTNACAVLAAPTTHELDARGSIDVTEPLTGLRTKSGMKVWTKCLPKNTNLGKFEPGTTMDSEIEMEVYALGVWIDGTELVYIDKFNYIARVQGVDYLLDARIAEGL